MSCCAYGCRSRFIDGKKLFALPSGKRDRERRLTWLLRIGRANFTGTTSTRLCEDHFSQDQFEPLILKNHGVKKLKQDAVPSIFTPFVQIKQEVPDISTADSKGHSLNSTHDIPNLVSDTSETTLHISDIHTEGTSTADFKDGSFNSTHAIQDLLSTTSESTLQISDIRTEDTCTTDFKNPSLKCTQVHAGIPNLLSSTSETNLQISGIRTEDTSTADFKDHSLNSTHGTQDLLSATSESTLQIRDIRTENTSTADFKDPFLKCMNGIPNLLSATSETTLQITDIRTADTSTRDFKDPSLGCRHGIPNLLSATSETTLQITDIRTADTSTNDFKDPPLICRHGTRSDDVKDPSLNCTHGIQDSLAATSETTLQISDIRTADAGFWSEGHDTPSGMPEEKLPSASCSLATATFPADSSAYNGAPVFHWPPPEGQILPSLSNAELHKRMLDLEYKLESARRKVQLAYRTKNKVTKEYEKLKAELARYLAPDQLHCMAKNSRGALWSEDTIRKALKVRLACGSRGYNLVKKILAPLPCQRTLQRHLEVLKATPGALPELLHTLSDEVNSMEDHEKHVIDVGEVEMTPANAVDPTSGEILGVSADPLTDTPE